MLFSSVFISTLLAGTAWAEGVNMRQNMPKPSNTNSAQGPQGSGQGNGQVKMHVIKVGSAENKLVFEPKNLTAEVGSMIQFQFWPKVGTSAVTSFKDDI
jgi:plastocyanin